MPMTTRVGVSGLWYTAGRSTGRTKAHFIESCFGQYLRNCLKYDSRFDSVVNDYYCMSGLPKRFGVSVRRASFYSLFGFYLGSVQILPDSKLAGIRALRNVVSKSSNNSFFLTTRFYYSSDSCLIHQLLLDGGQGFNFSYLEFLKFFDGIFGAWVDIAEEAAVVDSVDFFITL